MIRLLGTERNGRQGEGSLREEVEKKEEEETGEQTKEGERKKEKCKEEGDVESRRPGAQNGGGKWNGDRRRCRYHLWRQEEGKEAEGEGRECHALWPSPWAPGLPSAAEKLPAPPGRDREAANHGEARASCAPEPRLRGLGPPYRQLGDRGARRAAASVEITF